VATVGSTGTDDNASIESGKKRLGVALDVYGMRGLGDEGTYMFPVPSLQTQPETPLTVINWISEFLFPLALAL